MKYIALFVVILLALAAPAYAQVGSLGLFSDTAGNSCDISDPGGFLANNVHVVHKFLPGHEAIGVRFKIVPPAGATWSFVAFSTTFTPTGNLADDMSVGYGTCQTTTTLVGTALINSTVAAPACSYVSIGPGFTGQLGLRCNFEEQPIQGGQGIVNGNIGCPCNVATQPSTWGKVKALYR